MSTVNHLQEHLKSQIERLEAALNNKDKDVRELKTELRLATQKHDADTRCFNEAIMDIYEDVRTLIKRYIPSKVPPRDESSINAQAKDISTMLSILKVEMRCLTSKCRDAEQKENDLMKRVTTQTAVTNETRKQLEIIKEQFDEHTEKSRTEKYRTENELNAKIREKNREIAHLNLRVEQLQRPTGIDPGRKQTAQHRNPMKNVRNQADLLDSKLNQLEEQVNQQRAEISKKDMEIANFKQINTEQDKLFRELYDHFSQKERELKGEKVRSQEFENALEIYKQEINQLKRILEKDKEIMKSERAKEKDELRTEYERIMQERVTKAQEDGVRQGFDQCKQQNEIEIEQVKREITKLEGEKSELESNLAIITGELKESKERLYIERAEIKQQTSIFNERQNADRKEIERLKARNDESINKLHHAQEQLQAKYIENIEMEKEFNSHKTLAEQTGLNLMTNKKKLEEEVSKYKKETEELQQEIAKASRELAQSKEQIASMSQQVADHVKQLAEKYQAIHLHEKQIEELKLLHTKHIRSISDLKAGITQRDIIAKELDGKLKKERLNSSELSETLLLTKEKLSALQETNRALQEEVARLKKENDAHDIDDAKTNEYLKGIAEGEEKARSIYTAEITRLKSIIEERDRPIVELESAIKEQETQVAEITSQNRELEHKMETYREGIIRLQHDIAEKEAEHRDMSERMLITTETLENQAKEIDEKDVLIVDMRNTAEESSQKIIELEETIRKLGEDCQSNQSELVNMSSQLQSKRHEIDRLEKVVEELKQANIELQINGAEKNEASHIFELKEVKEQCQQTLSKEIEELQTRLKAELDRNAALENQSSLERERLKETEDRMRKEILEERENAGLYMNELGKAQHDLGTMTERAKQLEHSIQQLKERDDFVNQELLKEQRNAERHKTELQKAVSELKNATEKETNLKDDLKRERSKSTQIATKLQESRDELSKLDQRIIDLEQRNTETKQEVTKERNAAYKEGLSHGYERGLLETQEETTKIISAREEELKNLNAKLKEVEDELNKTNKAWQQEKEVTTKYNSEIQKAHAEITQLKAANKNGSPLMIEELQQRIAISESQFEHDRGTFEEQIKVLQKELARAEQQCREVAEENTRNVNRLAAEMNAKVSSDESSLENISIQARPMKIAEDYTWLMSNAWLDAKSALDEVNLADMAKEEKVKSEDEKVTSESEKVTSESDTVTSDMDKVISKMDKMTLETDKDTSEPAMDTSEADLVTMEEGQIKVKDRAGKVKEEDVKVISEADKVKLLFDILMTCEEEARAILTQVFRELHKALREPIQRLMARELKDEASKDSKQGDLPQAMITMIGDYFRRFSGKADLEYLLQRVISSLEAKYKHNSTLRPSILLQIDDISYFITESVRIAWKMAIQRPPMIFEATEIGKPWTKGSFLELTWGSNPNSPNAVIQYYKGPTLVHAGNAMVKGTVFVHSEKNPE